MVSLDLPDGTLPALPDGVPDQHITIVFLGRDVNDDTLQAVCERAAAIAAQMPPPSGTVGGLDSFPPSASSDGKTPVFAVPDVSGLDELRAAFEEFNASEHKDYKPHVTLSYLEPGEPMPDPVPETPVTFPQLSVHRGDEVWRFPFAVDDGGASKTSGPCGPNPEKPARAVEERELSQPTSYEAGPVLTTLAPDLATARPPGLASAPAYRPGTPAADGARHTSGSRDSRTPDAGSPDIRKHTAPSAKSLGAARDFHRHTDQLVEHYQPLIAKAIADMLPKQVIRQAIAAGQDQPPEAMKRRHDPAHATHVMRWALGLEEKLEKRAPVQAAQAAIRILNNGLKPADKLKAVLGDLWGDAGLQGANGATDAVNGTMLSSLQAVVSELPDDYWDRWQPGWGAAAAKAADGGLADLLDQADVTINGITGSTLDRLGNIIAEGIANGDSVGTIGKAAQSIVADPARALTIANTECARATTATSMDTYQQNGVQQLDWLLESDACDDCQANADAAPIAIDGEWPSGTAPVHPNCRCAVSPRIDTGGE